MNVKWLTAKFTKKLQISGLTKDAGIEGWKTETKYEFYDKPKYYIGTAYMDSNVEMLEHYNDGQMIQGSGGPAMEEYYETQEN